MRTCLLTTMPSAAMQLIYYVQTRGFKFIDVVVGDNDSLKYHIFKEYSAVNGFNLHFVGDLNGELSLETLTKLKPDIIKIVTGTIVRCGVINIPTLGVMNSHAAWLPDYRGTDSHFWAILTKGPQGCTEHFIDEGIDTGPILVRRKLKLQKNDTIASILHRNHHLNKWQGVADALEGLQSGKITPTPQQKKDGKQYFLMHPKLQDLCYRLMGESRPQHT